MATTEPSPTGDLTSVATPPARIAWSPPPLQRGTYQILLSSLALILLCTYTTLHYDVPTPSSRLRGPLKTFANRFLYFIGALLAPEFVTSYAFFDWLEARRLTAWFRQQPQLQRRQGPAEWTCVHSFYFLMGGMVHDFSASKSSMLSNRMPKRESTLHHRHQQPQALLGEEVLDLDNLALAIAGGADLGAFTKEEIWKLGRSEVLGKILTALQAGYMLVQIAARVDLGLEVACVEVLCVAYVPLTLLCYFFWWNKPFGANSTLTIPTRSSFRHRTFSSKSERYSLWRASSMPVVLTPTTSSSRLSHSCAFAFIAAIFAAPQVALWHSNAFSQHAERLLWRTGTLAMMMVALLQIPLLLLFHVRGSSANGGYGYNAAGGGDNPSKRKDQLVSAMVYFLALLYSVARVCVVVEALYSLHSSPASVYRVAKWSEYIPHFA